MDEFHKVEHVGTSKKSTAKQLLTTDVKKSEDRRIATLAKWVFSIASTLCTSSCLIPLIKYSEFNFQVSTPKRKQIFTATTSIYLLSATHKLIIFGHRIFSKPLDALTCLCMMPCVLYAAYLIFCMVIAFCLNEFVELIRGWSEILARFNLPGRQKEMTAFSDSRSSMVCVQVFLAMSASALAYPVLSCFHNDFPFLLTTTAKNMDLVGANWLPQWAWNVLFVPLETFSYAGPSAVVALGIMAVYIELGVEKQCVETLRKLSESKRMYVKTARLYTTLQLHNKIFTELFRPSLPPALFCTGFHATFGLYTALKTTDLPPVALFVMSYTCFVVLAAVYYLSSDAVAIIEASEVVIRNLRARDNPYFSRTAANEKKMHLKHMRALKPLEFPVGHFATLSFNVTKVVYEEILNQILFLLSL